MTTTLTPEVTSCLQEQFLGKRITVRTKIGTITGVCTFIGPNKHLPSWGLQVTIERMPLSNVEVKNISLVEQ